MEITNLAWPEPAPRRWGTSPWQRLRLTPLFLAIATARFVRSTGAARPPVPWPAWQPGLTVVLVGGAAAADAPATARALAAVLAELATLAEPAQLVVSAPAGHRADGLGGDIPAVSVEWVDGDFEGGSLDRLAAALPRVRHDWVCVLDAALWSDPGALRALLAERSDDVFAIAARIRDVAEAGSAPALPDVDGRTDWYADRLGVHLVIERVADTVGAVRGQLWAHARATLFRTEGLRERLAAGAGYRRPDAGERAGVPWEIVDWSLAAYRQGRRVLFLPAATFGRDRPGRGSHHAPPPSAEMSGQAAVAAANAVHNRLLFEARNAVVGAAADALLLQVCDLPYAEQHDFARWATVTGVRQARCRAVGVRPGGVPATLDWLRDRAWPRGHVARFEHSGASFRLGAKPDRPRVLVVTPFAVFPPRHGGARRTAAMLQALARDYAVVLVGDEGTLYDVRSLTGFDGLHAVHLVQRDGDPAAQAASDFDTRLAAHCHPALLAAVEAARKRFRPALVQVEHVELAPLVATRHPGERWLLDLHDAPARSDFASASAADRFATETLGRYDAVLVCSTEDRALIDHRQVVEVANGSTLAAAGFRPSSGAELLFLGPFRYPPNLTAAVAFARDAYPAIRAAHPDTTLRVLGGDEAVALSRAHPELRQAGIRIERHRDDVAAVIAQCALTVNPLVGIRGSAVKLVESLAAGRMCVSTVEAARGFGGLDLPGLVTVPDVAAMAAPIVALFADPAERHRRERPDPAALDRFGWDACLASYRVLCADLIAGIQQPTE